MSKNCLICHPESSTENIEGEYYYCSECEGYAKTTKGFAYELYNEIISFNQNRRIFKSIMKTIEDRIFNDDDIEEDVEYAREIAREIRNWNPDTWGASTEIAVYRLIKELANAKPMTRTEVLGLINIPSSSFAKFNKDKKNGKIKRIPILYTAKDIQDIVENYAPKHNRWWIGKGY